MIDWFSPINLKYGYFFAFVLAGLSVKSDFESFENNFFSVYQFQMVQTKVQKIKKSLGLFIQNQYLLLTILMFNFTMEWILGCQKSQIMVMVMKIALSWMFMMENGMMFHVTKKTFSICEWTWMVFCYRNCYDLLWEKIVVVIVKNFKNSRLKVENLQNVWDHYNNLFKQWKVMTIFSNRMLFILFLELSCIW